MTAPRKLTKGRRIFPRSAIAKLKERVEKILFPMVADLEDRVEKLERKAKGQVGAMTI